MKHSKWPCFFLSILTLLIALSIFTSCDSGKEAVDDITGNRAVKQFQKSEKELQAIVDQQAEQHKNIPDDSNEGNDQ